MSVIAKLVVRKIVPYGMGTFVELGCICDNDLMAAYAESESDKLFTRYSPWGEMRLNQANGWAVFTSQEEEHVQEPRPLNAYYVMLLREDEVGDDPEFKGAAAFVKVNCYGKYKFAGDGHRVELREVYGWNNKTPTEPRDYRTRRSVIEKLSWKMHVDNPPAEDGFVPGTDYWVAFYDAATYTRDTAIQKALHG